MRIAIVIPAYNEARTIRDLVRRALKQSKDVIVVDDGSTDDTSATLADQPAIVLRHERNEGKGAALWTGFARALALEVDAVITMDGDGQHRPEDIARLVLAARTHPHRVIIAARLRHRDAMPRLRYFGNRIADATIGWAAGQPIVDSQSGQRLYPITLVAELSLPDAASTRFAFESDVLIRAARLGYACIALPIETVYDQAVRRSHYRPLHDTWRISSVIWGHLRAARFNAPDLWRSLRVRPVVIDTEESVVADAVTESAAAPRQSGR